MQQPCEFVVINDLSSAKEFLSGPIERVPAETLATHQKTPRAFSDPEFYQQSINGSPMKRGRTDRYLEDNRAAKHRIRDGYGDSEGDGKTRTRSQDKGREVLPTNTTGEELKERRDSISTVNTNSVSHLDAGDIDSDGHPRPVSG
jgi:hypothetical protein